MTVQLGFFPLCRYRCSPVTTVLVHSDGIAGWAALASRCEAHLSPPKPLSTTHNKQGENSDHQL
jgi:hypothetical protein